MKAIGYVRVSTEEQANEGVSLEMQESKVRAYCDLNDFELLHIHIDAGISGARADNRPGLQSAIKDACSNQAVLVVYSLSRLTRNTKDTIAIAEQLDRAKADLVSLSEKIDTTTAAGKMVFRMVAVLNEFERDQISERTKTAMDHMRRNNKRISRKIPYGYTLDADAKTLIPNERQQEIIQIMQDLRTEGISLRKIGAYLESQGILTQSCGKWTATTIKQILDRKEKLG